MGSLNSQTANPLVMAVDLDGTLVQTDMLHETFWRSLAEDPLNLFRSLLALIKGGRPGLKGWLGARTQIDPASLPYHEGLLDLIRDWRVSGRKVVLVTAADQIVADSIAASLGLFDAVYGTRPGHNLKGMNKSRFLVETFGEGGFVYAGDSKADLWVWPQASSVIGVGLNPGVRANVEDLRKPLTYLAVARPGWRDWWGFLIGLAVAIDLSFTLVVSAALTLLPIRLASATAVAGAAMTLAAFILCSIALTGAGHLLRQGTNGIPHVFVTHRIFLPKASLLLLLLGFLAMVLAVAAGPVTAFSLLASVAVFVVFPQETRQKGILRWIIYTALRPLALAPLLY